MTTKLVRRSIAVLLIVVGIGGGLVFVLSWGNLVPITRGVVAFAAAAAIWFGEVLWEGNPLKRLKQMMTPMQLIETGIWTFLTALVLVVSAVYPFGAVILVVMILYEFLRPRKEDNP